MNGTELNGGMEGRKLSAGLTLLEDLGEVRNLSCGLVRYIDLYKSDLTHFSLVSLDVRARESESSSSQVNNDR